MKRAAVALIHDPCGHVLCVWNKMAWSLPGGKVEPFETPSQAVVRELLEEVGIQRGDIYYVGQIYSAPGSLDPAVNVAVFRVTIGSGCEPRQCEPDSPVKWASVRWFIKNTGPYPPFYKCMFQLIGRAKKIGRAGMSLPPARLG